MKRFIKKSVAASLRQSHRGQGLVEYAVLLFLIVVAIAGTFTLTQGQVSSTFNNVNSNVSAPGSVFTPDAANTLPPVSIKGYTPPTNTPIPPTATPKPTATPLPPTNTPSPTLIQQPTPANAQTPNPVATQTASAIYTQYGSYGGNGAANRYFVDPNGWNPAVAPDFCGTGSAVKNGNAGIGIVTLSGNQGDLACFRIDMWINGNTSPIYTQDLSIFDQIGGKGPATGYQLSLDPNTPYTGGPQTILATFNQTNIVSIYVKVLLTADVCTNHTDERFKGIDTAQAAGIKISLSPCGPPNTPTPVPTSTPVPAN